MADNKDDKTKKGLLRTIMYPLEKRLLLDASTLEATVNAIPNGVLNLDAQDIDGDGDFSAGDQPITGTTVQNWKINLAVITMRHRTRLVVGHNTRRMHLEQVLVDWFSMGMTHTI